MGFRVFDRFAALAMFRLPTRFEELANLSWRISCGCGIEGSRIPIRNRILLHRGRFGWIEFKFYSLGTGPFLQAGLLLLL